MNRKSDQLEVGQVVGRKYRIVKLLGIGATGAVYEAEHVELGRRVALKVLLARFFTDKKMRSRFIREARSSVQIEHPSVVDVYELAEEGPHIYIVMELLEGEELKARIRREGQLPVASVAEMGRELVDAIAAAHCRGIIHRDLKPQNVFIAKQGRYREKVKVLDFGLAKVRDRVTNLALTKSGDTFGTPVYTSPEQLRDAKRSDTRTDIYAIGVILYEALTNSLPFKGRNVYELIYNVVRNAPTPLRDHRSDVPPELAAAIMKAIAKNPDERFQKVEELGQALEGFQ